MPRGKKGGKTQMPFGNGKADQVEKLKQQQQDKIDAALITDERVAAKIKELEAQIEENKSALEKEKEALEEEYKKKKEALDERELALDLKKEELDGRQKAQENRQKELEDTEAEVKKKCDTAVAEEIQKIKEDEASIREKEKESIYADWEADKTQQKKDLEKYIKDQRKKIETELEKAHKERVDAEDKKLAKIHEADEAIEAKRAELTEEYAKKAEESAKKKIEYEKKIQELEEEEADLKAESEYVQDLKAKYSQYSEKEVLKLQQQIAHYETQIEVYTERIKELSGKTAQMEGALLDADGESLVAKINELETQLEEAVRRNDELANLPSEEEIERLRANTKELENIRLALDDEKQKRAKAESQISAYAMSARELENARVTSAALESLNNQLQMKLRYISEQYKSTQESKFKVLVDIDKEISAQDMFNPKGFNSGLEELCEYVRAFGSYYKGLYYSIDTIRVFFASLAASEKASRLLILQGLSGTGKSSLPRLVAEALGVECKVVPVQPSWRDNRELLGYDNDFTNRFKETDFTKFLYEASALPNRKKIYLIVLDEMNLARIEYYFADFLSVLEKPNQTDWIIPLVSGYSELDEDQKPKYLDYSNEAANICVTNNVWFVGTANNDDSTSLITDKVYDRAQILDMDDRAEAFSAKKVPMISMDIEELLSLFEEAKSTKNKLTESDKKNISLVDEYLKEMDITFGNRIMGQIDEFVPVYIACGGTKEEAIDYLLAHKILRKLDERYEPYLINKLEDLELGLNEIYGEGKFVQSIKKINKLKEKIAG